jgi:hypothetical protein
MKIPLLLFISLFLICSCNSPSKFPIPTVTRAANESDQAILRGTLELKDKCLKIGHYTLIWPYKYSAEKKGDSVFVHDQTNKIIAHTGMKLRITGGEISEISGLDPKDVNLQDTGCKGRGWLVGAIEPLK